MRVLMALPADSPTYLTWGWVSVSVPNLLAILATIALLVLALVLPFPSGHDDADDEQVES